MKLEKLRFIRERALTVKAGLGRQVDYTMPIIEG